MNGQQPIVRTEVDLQLILIGGLCQVDVVLRVECNTPTRGLVVVQAAELGQTLEELKC